MEDPFLKCILINDLEISISNIIFPILFLFSRTNSFKKPQMHVNHSMVCSAKWYLSDVFEVSTWYVLGFTCKQTRILRAVGIYISVLYVRGPIYDSLITDHTGKYDNTRCLTSDQRYGLLWYRLFLMSQRYPILIIGCYYRVNTLLSYLLQSGNVPNWQQYSSRFMHKFVLTLR